MSVRICNDNTLTGFAGEIINMLWEEKAKVGEKKHPLVFLDLLLKKKATENFPNESSI
jgi:hypothetical protein